MSQISLYNQMHMILRREWENKTDPANAAAKINAQFKRQIIAPDKVLCHWYTYFEQQENTELFDNKLAVYSTTHSNQRLRNTTNSIMWIDEKEYLERENKRILARDGRFLISSYWKKGEKETYVEVYNLFQATKRLHSLSFDTQFPITTSSIISDNYLVLIIQKSKTHSGRLCDLCLLKIDYDKLDVEELKLIEINLNSKTCYFLVDQLDKQKFLVRSTHQIIPGQICGDEISLERNRRFQDVFDFGENLVGNKLQGFIKDWDSNNYPLKFCEVNLQTERKEKEIDVPIILDKNDNILIHEDSETCFWRGNHFYGFFEVRYEPRKQRALFMFNLETLKWSNVRFFVHRREIDMFVDENEILTLSVKNHENLSVFYRIGMRKPDTLKNLTWFTALRELNLYGDGKYLNAAKAIGIQI